MENSELKSVVTCDMEGRIETFGKDAEEIFGYSADEIIGKKRVSLFSPGLVVLGHVETWLKTAVREGAFETQTAFIRKDGSMFAAQIKITPTFKEGEQIGYCGVTVPLPDVDPQSVMPPTSIGTHLMRWLVITRAPFLTAMIVPILIGAALASQAGAFTWLLFGLSMAAGIALHVAANTFNDFFDWQSGTDQANNDYFLPFSGGSRSLELGLISLKGLLILAITSLVTSAMLGGMIFAVRGPGVILFGLIGAFSAYFYTAPPLRLAARGGLGELLVGMNFGPLAVAGTYFVFTGEFSGMAAMAGVPVGLLTAAILWINEYPDAESDALTGKNHLVVVLGKETARWGYIALMVGAFGVTLYGALTGLFPVGTLVTLIALPMAIYAIRILMAHYEDRSLIRANVATIGLHVVAGLLFGAGVYWTETIQGIIGL